MVEQQDIAKTKKHNHWDIYKNGAIGLVASAMLTILLIGMLRLVTFVSDTLFPTEKPWVIDVINEIAGIEAVFIFTGFFVGSTYISFKLAKDIS